MIRTEVSLVLAASNIPANLSRISLWGNVEDVMHLVMSRKTGGGLK